MKVGDKVVYIGTSSDPDKKKIYIVSFYGIKEGHLMMNVADLNVNVEPNSNFLGWAVTSWRKVDPFRNELTEKLAVQVLTDLKKPQIERIQIKELQD